MVKKVLFDSNSGLKNVPEFQVGDLIHFSYKQHACKGRMIELYEQPVQNFLVECKEENKEKGDDCFNCLFDGPLHFAEYPECKKEKRSDGKNIVFSQVRLTLKQIKENNLTEYLSKTQKEFIHIYFETKEIIYTTQNNLLSHICFVYLDKNGENNEWTEDPFFDDDEKEKEEYNYALTLLQNREIKEDDFSFLLTYMN